MSKIRVTKKELEAKLEEHKSALIETYNKLAQVKVELWNTEKRVKALQDTINFKDTRIENLQSQLDGKQRGIEQIRRVNLAYKDDLVNKEKLNKLLKHKILSQQQIIDALHGSLVLFHLNLRAHQTDPTVHQKARDQYYKFNEKEAKWEELYLAIDPDTASTVIDPNTPIEDPEVKSVEIGLKDKDK